MWGFLLYCTISLKSLKVNVTITLRTGDDSSNKGCFGRKTNLFRESEDFAGNRETWKIFREIWDIFGTLSKDLILHVIKQYMQWYAPSVYAVFYVFWHLKMAELPMIWKDQSATFPTKIAWSWSAIDHVQSPADWHKNRAGARHILSVYLAETDIQNNFKNRTKY